MRVPEDHPRAECLRIRERLVQGMREGIVVPQGLIAHGRGEAFDYILGEETVPPAETAIRAAAAAFHVHERPVISVNGNTAALCPKELVELSETTGAPLEVNLFHRTEERARLIAERLEEAGAREVLGADEEHLTRLPEPSSERAVVDERGIARADMVLVPLEDGDRTEALKRMGKTVVAVDLNPLSRTAMTADVTIVDNVIRCLKRITEEYSDMTEREAAEILSSYDNSRVLSEVLEYMRDRLGRLAHELLEGSGEPAQG